MRRFSSTAEPQRAWRGADNIQRLRLRGQPADHKKGIGTYVDDSNSSYQIIVTMEALGILYKILSCLLDELREIDLLFRIETDAQRPGRHDDKTGEFHKFSDDELKKYVLPDLVKRLAALQQTRKGLQKLPAFPDADLIRALNEQASAAEGK